MNNNSLLTLVQLPTIQDDCKLVVGENSGLPFAIKRIYYIYDAKTNEPRGFHAHKETQQILFCLQGRVKIVLDDGRKNEEVLLTDPSKGVFLDKMIWHEMHEMEKDTILLVLASEEYDESDYIRNYNKFKLITHE